MRNLKAEGLEHDELVAHADREVSAQTTIVRRISLKTQANLLHKKRFLICNRVRQPPSLVARLHVLMGQMTNADDIKISLDRIQRLDRTIRTQREFLATIPDPDTRYRAEANLMEMVTTVEALRELHEKLLAAECGLAAHETFD